MLLVKILLFTGGFFFASAGLTAYPVYPESLGGFGDYYSITERHDIRQRINGRYQGFILRELRGVLHTSEILDGEKRYEGSFFVFRRMTRGQVHVARIIDDIVPAAFSITPDGRMRTATGQSVPPIQNFPVLPGKELGVGDTWREHGLRVVDPQGGNPTRVRFYCEYQYRGIDTQGGSERHWIRAQYALRYRAGEDPYGDPGLRETHGRHIVDIYFPVSGDMNIFMRDSVDDSYYYHDGTVIQESGFILTWINSFAGMDRTVFLDTFQRIIDEDPQEELDLRIQQRPEGLLLTLDNIHFYPDEYRMLPGQEKKIRTIARILKEAEGHSFLVTGHTADVGSAQSQLLLSEQRAQVITSMLVEMGISSERLSFIGRGGTVPVAPNDTEENRARNRRVEIIILEGRF